MTVSLLHPHHHPHQPAVGECWVCVWPTVINGGDGRMCSEHNVQVATLAHEQGGAHYFRTSPDESDIDQVDAVRSRTDTHRGALLRWLRRSPLGA